MKSNKTGQATPPDDVQATPVVKKEEEKRYPDHPGNSKIKTAWSEPREKKAGCDRIRFGEKTDDKTTSIENYRYLGSQLWFIQPGSVVHCDECDRPVSQVQGSLQGAPGKSQFAQNKFVCSECLGLLG